MTKYVNPITRNNGSDVIVVPERVGAPKIDDAVDTATIQDGAITEEKIADGVLWEFQDDWVGTTIYDRNAVVRRNGALYISTSDGNLANDPAGPPPVGAVLLGYTASSGATGITGSGGIYVQDFVPTATMAVYGATIKFNSIPGAGTMQVHIGTGWPGAGWMPLASKTINLSGVLAGQSVDVVFPVSPLLLPGVTYQFMLQGSTNVDAAQVVPYTSLDIAGATNGVGNKGGNLYQFTTPNSTYRLLFQLRMAGTPFWKLMMDAGAYLHTQAAPSTVWNIDHHRGYDPAGITVIDNTGYHIEGFVVTYPDPGQAVRLTFDLPFAGTARLS
jgi:hypothetical protein